MENLPTQVKYATEQPQPKQIPPTNPCDALLLNDRRMSQLAMEIARELYPFEQIIASYGISPEEFALKIQPSAPFMAYYAEARAIWNSSGNAALRSTLKAGIIFEQWLEEADKLLHDPNSPMAPKVELGKYLARVAGFDNVHNAKNNESGVNDRMTTVTINLNHGRQIVIQKENDPVDVTPVAVEMAAPVVDLPAQVNEPRIQEPVPVRESRFPMPIFGSGTPTAGPGILPPAQPLTPSHGQPTSNIPQQSAVVRHK